MSLAHAEKQGSNNVVGVHLGFRRGSTTNSWVMIWIVREDVAAENGPETGADDWDDVEKVSFWKTLLITLHEESSVVDSSKPGWHLEDSHDDEVDEEICIDALEVKEEAKGEDDGEDTLNSVNDLNSAKEPHSKLKVNESAASFAVSHQILLEAAIVKLLLKFVEVFLSWSLLLSLLEHFLNNKL